MVLQSFLLLLNMYRIGMNNCLRFCLVIVTKFKLALVLSSHVVDWMDAKNEG